MKKSTKLIISILVLIIVVLSAVVIFLALKGEDGEYGHDDSTLAVTGGIFNTNNSKGNGNILNGGWAVSDDKYIYLSAKSKIFKISKDNKKDKSLVYDAGEGVFLAELNLYKNTLYFTLNASLNNDRIENIYSVGTDGKDLKLIIKDINYDAYLTVFNHQLYFLNKAGNIATSKMDGSDLKVLNHVESRFMNVTSHGIYYVNVNDKAYYSYKQLIAEEMMTAEAGKLYKMSLDGTKNDKLTDYGVGFVCADDKYIYISNCEDGVAVASEGDSWYSGKLYRIKASDFSREKLTDFACSEINFDKDWIYFSSFSPRGIFRINKTTKTMQLIIKSTYAGRLNLTDKDMFYSDIPNSFESMQNNQVYSLDSDFGLFGIALDKGLLNIDPATYAKDSENSGINSNVNNGGNISGSKNQFILPMSSLRRLQESDLAGLTKEQLALARNEIFARHGYIFTTEKYKLYFSQMPWYVPNAAFSDSLLNDIEMYNSEFLKQHEK